MEQDLPNPLAKKSFFELTLRERVTLLNHLCDFRLDAVDVPEQLKVSLCACLLFVVEDVFVVVLCRLFK